MTERARDHQTDGAVVYGDRTSITARQPIALQKVYPNCAGIVPELYPRVPIVSKSCPPARCAAKCMTER